MPKLKSSNSFSKPLKSSFSEDFNNREYIVGKCEEGNILSIYLNHLSEEVSTVRTSENKILEKGHYYVLKPKTKQHIDHRGEDYYICEVIEEIDIQDPRKIQYYNNKYGEGLIKTRVSPFDSDVTLTVDSTIGVTYQSQYLNETNEKYDLSKLLLDCQHKVWDHTAYCYYVCANPRQSFVQMKEFIQEYVSHMSRDFSNSTNWFKVIPYSKETQFYFVSSHIRFETEEEAKKSGYSYKFVPSPSGLLYDKECKSYNQKAVDFFTSVLSPEEIEYLKGDEHGYGLRKILCEKGMQLDCIKETSRSAIYTLKMSGDDSDYILLEVQDGDCYAMPTKYWNGANIYSAIHNVTEDNQNSELQQTLKPYWITLERVHPNEIVVDKRDIYNRCAGVLEDINKILEMSDEDIYASLVFKE